MLSFNLKDDHVEVKRDAKEFVITYKDFRTFVNRICNETSSTDELCILPKNCISLTSTTGKDITVVLGIEEQRRKVILYGTTYDIITPNHIFLIPLKEYEGTTSYSIGNTRLFLARPGSWTKRYTMPFPNVGKADDYICYGGNNTNIKVPRGDFSKLYNLVNIYWESPFNNHLWRHINGMNEKQWFEYLSTQETFPYNLVSPEEATTRDNEQEHALNEAGIEDELANERD